MVGKILWNIIAWKLVILLFLIMMVVHILVLQSMVVIPVKRVKAWPREIFLPLFPWPRKEINCFNQKLKLTSLNLKSMWRTAKWNSLTPRTYHVSYNKYISTANLCSVSVVLCNLVFLLMGLYSQLYITWKETSCWWWTKATCWFYVFIQIEEFMLYGIFPRAQTRSHGMFLVSQWLSQLCLGRNKWNYITKDFCHDSRSRNEH